ncbi:ATP-binding cassette domain-containing protein [Rhodococcus hoagii]|nr:ATP-binding cassette domain-containing protein [Prescottella equi]
MYGVLGPNGAGKTTTVRMLATLLRPDGGEARIFGRDVVRESTAVRSLVVVTGQYASVDEDLTRHRESRHLLPTARPEPARRQAQVDRTARGVRPDGGGVQTTEDFSGGMRRRLDLAASLIARPPLLFLDEPTPSRSPDPRPDVGHDPTARRRRIDGPAHDPVPGRGRPVGRSDRGDRPRQGHRRRHRGRVEGVRGTSALQLTLADRDRIDEARALISTVLGLEATVTPESGRITGRSRTRRSPGTCSSGCVTVRSPWTRSRLQAQPRRGLPHHHRSRDRRVRGSAA